jgi:hypothetical protein
VAARRARRARDTVLLSDSRDEEVVGRGERQARQPRGEFNCPRVFDGRPDPERITAILHRDLACWRGIPDAGKGSECNVTGVVTGVVTLSDLN